MRKKISKELMPRTVKLVSLVWLSVLCGSCILPQSESMTSRTRVYRRPVDVDNRIKFHVNQVGYDLYGPKQAVVESVGKGTTFDLVDAATGKVVFTGKLRVVEEFDEWGGGPVFHVADFSSYHTPSTVKMKIKDYTSVEFAVEKNVLFRETFELVLDYFHASRAVYPAVWQTDSNLPFFNSQRRADVRGGWYDASGDISKYLSHLSYANLMNPQQIPLTAWALAFVHDVVNDTNADAELKKRIAEEAAFGADYLTRILDVDGYFYINVFDHWSGDMYQRQICAFETQSGTMTQDWQAAFREGGGLAIAALARVSAMKVSGDFSSVQYLDAAKKGFAHLQKNNLKYVDDGKENIIDDYAALLAAVELYAATEDEAFLAAARIRASNLKSRLHGNGYFVADDGKRPFWHASDAGLPVVALIRYLDIETDEELKYKAIDVIEKHLEYLLNVTFEVANPFGYARQHYLFDNKVTSGFFIPHQNESGYWWQGENARLGSLATASLLGVSYISDDSIQHGLKSFSANQLNWILGMNPFGYCFLKGVGTRHPEPYSVMPNDKHHGDIDGGIANGITGSAANGEGIEFWGAPGMASRDDFRWRWLEQWLPHSTWYLLAVALSAKETH
ncbi:MAG: glycoside hydrolase family 9 protein [Deltaproteobacteria bacterium]|nr:glycoside hydrolase family 9 protein [Deltaproteobacteria bacterium]